MGDWEEGKKHGKGTWAYANCDRYDGDWKDEKRHGYGEYTNVHGYKYTGDWEEGKKHGKGTCTNVNGDEYSGEWKDGKPHGSFGTYTYANGKVYENVSRKGWTRKWNNVCDSDYDPISLKKENCTIATVYQKARSYFTEHLFN